MKSIKKIDYSDKGLALVTTHFYKPYFLKMEGDDLKTMLEHTRDFWFPQTLDCLKEGEDEKPQFITELTESLQASLNLLVLLAIVENKRGIKVITEDTKVLKEKYLEPLVHTIKAGFDAIKQDGEQSLK